MPMLANNAEKFVILNLAMSTDFLSAMVPQPCWSDACVKPILGFDRGSEILLLQALYWLAVCANNGTADERPAACPRELGLETPCPSIGAGVRKVEASVICIVRSLMHGRHPRQIIWLTIREIELDRGPMQFRQCHFGSKADISARAEHVHFTTKSGHWVA